MTVKIKRGSPSGDLYVESPYDGDFIRRVKQIGGTWHRPDWRVPAAAEEQLRALLWEIYGTDGTHKEEVTLHVHLDHAVPGRQKTLRIGPVVALEKMDRDRAPKVGPGCMMIVGELYDYGGSRANPHITHSEGAVLRVAGVPADLGRKLAEEDPDAYEIEIPEPEEAPEEEAAGTPIEWTLAEAISGAQGIVNEYLPAMPILGDHQAYLRTVESLRNWLDVIIQHTPAGQDVVDLLVAMHKEDMATVYLAEDNAGGLYVGSEEHGWWDATPVANECTFVELAKAIIDGETEDWTIEHHEDDTAMTVEIVARYRDGKIKITRAPAWRPRRGSDQTA